MSTIVTVCYKSYQEHCNTSQNFVYFHSFWSCLGVTKPDFALLQSLKFESLCSCFITCSNLVQKIFLLWLIRGIAGRREVVQLPWIAELKAQQIGQQNGYFK